VTPEDELHRAVLEQVRLSAGTRSGSADTVAVNMPPDRAHALIELGRQQAIRDREIEDLREAVAQLLPLLDERKRRNAVADFLATSWGKGAAALGVLLLLLNIAKATRDLVSLGPAYDGNDTALVDDSMDGPDEDGLVGLAV
jgi:hypothetical protein